MDVGHFTAQVARRSASGWCARGAGHKGRAGYHTARPRRRDDRM